MSIVFCEENLQEKFGCSANFEVETVALRVCSIRIESQSGSQIVESTDQQELAADRFRCRTENTQQVENAVAVVAGSQVVRSSVRLRTRVSVVLDAELQQLWRLCEQVAPLLCALELNQQRKRCELDFRMSE